jgi:uncharacterized membrane protein (Fun14 family)
MAEVPWGPLAFVFIQGLLVGLVVGFAVRKLNKVVAAVVGFSVLAINVVWFARMMEIDIPIPRVNDVMDFLLRLLPFSASDLLDQFGTMMPLLTSLPFIGGQLVGGFVGFRLA